MHIEHWLKLFYSPLLSSLYLRRMPRFSFFLGLLILLSACQASETDESKMIFRYNESAGVSSLDPAFSRNLENLWVCNMLFNGLVEIDDQLDIKPAIAQSWTIDSTGTFYRFQLRDDIYFHDSEVFPAGKGRKVVAADVVYSFERVLSPELASPGSWVFAAAADSLPFRAIGDTVVEIRLSKAFPPFLGILGMKYCSIVPREAVDYYKDDFRKNPVGTGPFRFHFWIENTRLVLLPNDDYFERDEQGNKLPYIDAVSVSFIPDKGAAYLDFVKGNFDMISGLHSSYADELLTPTGELNPLYANDFKLEKHPFLNTDYLAFNVNPAAGEQGIWKNPDFRRAMSYAIDRRAMVRYLRNNVYTPGTGGFIPKGMPGFQPTVGYDFQPDSVRKILDRLGFPGGKGLPTIQLSTTTDYVDICEYVQHQLGNFGIPIKVDVLPASVHRERSARGDLIFFRKSWLADYPDDENFMALFYSANMVPNGPNYSQYSNPIFDKLYDRALATVEREDRIELYRQMDSIVMLTAPVMPLYYDEVVRILRKNVEGLDRNPLNVLDLRRVKLTLNVVQ